MTKFSTDNPWLVAFLFGVGMVSIAQTVVMIADGLNAIWLGGHITVCIFGMCH